MKFRSDFVTNSSSTSYIISIQITLANGKVLEWTGGAEESFELPTNPASPKEIAEANSFSEIDSLLSSYASLEENYSYEYSAEDDKDYYKCVYLDELTENIDSIEDIISVQISSKGLGHGGADFIKEGYIFNKKTNAYYGGWESSTGEKEIDCVDDYIRCQLNFDDYYEVEHDKIVAVPQGVSSIGDYAFKGHTDLTSITIPDSVTSIGDEAFSGCTGLTSITIPDSMTSIGYGAFEGCTKIKAYLEEYKKKMKLKKR